MVFEKNNHRWEWIGSGSCRLRAWRDGETAVPWWVADENTIDGTTTKVGVRVQEENCASGKNAAGRIERLWVFYGNKRIVVTYFVKPLTGGQTCQGNPSTPAVLRLEEPVGDRRLIDGATP
jgi:hypothetical protein